MINHIANGRNRGLRAFLARLAVGMMLAPVGMAGVDSATAPPVSAATCGDGGNFGATLLGGSWPGGFTGVPVYSNGSNSEFVGGCKNSATTPSGKAVTTGTEWQCVELVNRLYVTKGWITSTWHGNGGRSSESARDSMFDEAPSSLQKQAQGLVTYVGPGDVVSVNVIDGRSFEPGGHVLIVSAVSGSAVTYVSQNAGSNTVSTVRTTGQLESNGDLTVKASGSWTYPVIGVVHAPESGPSGLLHFVYYVGSDGVLRVDHWTGSVWQNDDLGVAVESGTSPSAYLGAGGTEFVHYVGSDGVLRVDHWTCSVWQNDDLGVAVESGTSPSAYLA